MSAAFEFVGGLIVGFFEAAWELLKGLWEMLKTPLGWLLLAIVVILAVIVVVLFGWEALIIAGIIIGLCMAAYYIYLAVTTPGLSPYERGKLFGKALFNVVLSFVGVELEGSNLLRFTQWGGLIPQAIRLVQRAGSLGDALQLIRAVGSIKTALQLVEALGSVERVVQLVQEAGGASKLIPLIDRVGGVENLLRLIANPKIGDVSTLVHLLENAKIGNVATLERLLANAKIADVATLERLLANAKITDAATLERLLANAKIADVATLERLLANTKIADAATLERLLANTKIADVATLERLLANAKIADAATLERLLNNAKIADVATLERLLSNAKITDVGTLERLLNDTKIPDAATLERLLANPTMTDAAMLERMLKGVDDLAQLDRLLAACGNDAKMVDDYLRLAGAIGGSGVAAKLEAMIAFAKARGATAADCRSLLDIAGGDASKFSKMWELAQRFRAGRGGAPSPGVGNLSPEFSSANTPHFLERHTYDFFDIGQIKANNTFFPPGWGAAEVTSHLEQAITNIRAIAASGGATLPMQGQPIVTVGGFQFQVGWLPAGTLRRIGQFFPKSGPGVENIARNVMQAIAKIIGP